MSNPAFDLLEAFTDSGMSEDNAKKATNALLRSHDNRLDKIEETQAKHSQDLADLKADNRLLKWMVGFAIAVLLVIGSKVMFG